MKNQLNSEMRYVIITALAITLVGCKTSVPVMHHNLVVPAPTPAPMPAPETGSKSIEKYHEYTEQIQETNKITLPVKPKSPSAKNQIITVKSGSKVMPDIDQATSQVMSQLFQTSVGIAGPTQGSVDEVIDISLVIDSSTTTQLVKNLGREYQGQHIVVDTIKISSLAWPEIIAPDFEISPSVASEQPITSDSPTVWTWRLKPKNGGKFVIFIDVYAIVYLDDKQTKKKYRTLRHPIEITVPEKSIIDKISAWIDSKWDWFWSGIIIPVGGFLWAVSKRKKRRRSKRFIFF